MERPKRVTKSTRNYDDFYYPASKKNKVKNVVKTDKSRNQNQETKKSNNLSTNSIPNQPTSQALIPSQVMRTNSRAPQTLTSPAKNQGKNPRPTKTAQTQTTQKTARQLTEILNELYTNPDFPSAYGGQLRKFIMSKDSISKHRQRRKIFKRRKVKIVIVRIQNLIFFSRFLCTDRMLEFKQIQSIIGTMRDIIQDIVTY